MNARLLSGAALACPALIGLGLYFGGGEPQSVAASSASDGTEAQKPGKDLLGGPWLEWPLPEGVGRVYQAYGQAERDNPIQVHEGLDLAAPAGTPVYSPLSGEVSMNFGFAYEDKRQGIAIRGFHSGHEVFIKLLHLDRASIQVLLGDEVQAGDFLGVIADWGPDEDFESHLHIEIGGASLYAKMKKRRDGIHLSPRDAFAAMKNPLSWLKSPKDEVEPALVPLSEEKPILFRRYRERTDEDDDEPGEELLANELSGLVDIEFGVRDGYSKTQQSTVMPNRLRLQIVTNDSERREVLHRALLLDGPLETTTIYSRRLYLHPPKEWPEHHGFCLRLLSLRGLGGEGLPPTPWDTAECGGGNYLIRILASDYHNHDVLLGEYPAVVVAQ